MLALKSALADQDDIPVLVFDEIDANIGGEIASKVGAKMRELGRSRQVLCITHLPQVAAAASSQFVVTKEFKDKRTRTSLVEASRRISRGGNRKDAWWKIAVRAGTCARIAERANCDEPWSRASRGLLHSRSVNKTPAHA